MQYTSRLGWSWLALCAALALHVTDEALTGFLGVWNPTGAAQVWVIVELRRTARN